MKIEVRKGSFTYPRGKEVLHNLNFSFNSSEIVAILGRNGAGKTTLLKCLLGLQHWSDGTELIDGKALKPNDYKSLWKNIAYVPQAKSNVLALSVREMVVLGRTSRWGAFQSPSKKDWIAADKAIEITGIEAFANYLCNEISGGQYQVALLARALCCEPKLLVLDEPESNLDFKNQLMILQLLSRLSQELKIGSVINTHYPAHALEIADKALVLMRDGSTAFGAVKEVVTAQNLEKSFGLPVRIEPLDIPERPGYAAVVALGAQDKTK